MITHGILKSSLTQFGKVSLAFKFSTLLFILQVLKTVLISIILANEAVASTLSTRTVRVPSMFSVTKQQLVGGWTVFQKRLDGSVDFYLNWTNYKTGFGSLNGEFWLGLDRIHRLTNSSNNKLRVDLEDMSGNTAYAEYSVFKVGNEATKYQLNVRNYSGKFSLRSLQNACASRLKNRVFRVLVHYPDV